MMVATRYFFFSKATYSLRICRSTVANTILQVGRASILKARKKEKSIL